MQDVTPKRRRFNHKVPPEQDGWRLDAIVRDWLSRELATPLSKAAVRKLVMAGAVRLDGQPNRRAGAVIGAASQLEARVDVAKLHRARSTGLSPADADLPTALAVLYEDDDLIAVAKPAGLPVHATADARRADLFSLVRHLLSPRPASSLAIGDGPYLGLHHRLDVDTSGVVLFTKQERANAGLARQFAEGQVEKVYHAVVAKHRDRRERAWRVEDCLAPTGSGRHARMAAVARGGVRAVTAFRLARSSATAWLVEARPETGRKHQVRAHLAGSGMPILGDTRYGGALRLGRCVIPRTMLHARSLTLAHPVTNARLSIVAPYPRDFADVVACLFAPRPATISRR